MIVLYVILVLGGGYAEGYCLSNDYEQSVGRVFQQIVRMLVVADRLPPLPRFRVGRVSFCPIVGIDGAVRRAGRCILWAPSRQPITRRRTHHHVLF